MLCRGARKKAVGRNLPSSSEQTSAAGVSIDRARPRSARPSRHDVDLAERDEFSDDVRDVQRHPDERDANLHRGRVQGRRAGATAIRPDPLARCRIRRFRARAPPIRSILRSSAPSIESNRIESNRSVARASPRSRARRSRARRPPRPSLTRPDPPRSQPANESNRIVRPSIPRGGETASHTTPFAW